MNIATHLLKANHVGIRNFKEHLSTRALQKLVIITDRGVPVSVNLPYQEVLGLLDMIDELLDAETINTIHEGRSAIKAGIKGVPVSHLFKRLRTRHK